MHYCSHLVCVLFTFLIVACGNSSPVLSSAFGIRSGEGRFANEVHECKECKMPTASQVARLVMMNTLKPPYAALEVPSETLLMFGQIENIYFHFNSSVVTGGVDVMLGSSERRQFARSVLKNLGEIGTTELLEDCCWSVQDHVCFAVHSEDTTCSLADADHILTASSSNGDCAIIFQQGNDEIELQAASAMKGQGKHASVEHAEFVWGPKKIRARVSGVERQGVSMIATEFEVSTALPVYDRWMSLASSSKCQRVFMAGFSQGSALAQYHRFDTGVFRNDGLLSDVCKFGDDVKDCSIYLFGTIFPFQGSKIELASCTGDYSFVVEDDLIAGLPEVARIGIFCPSCSTTLRSGIMEKFAEFSPIVGVRSYQLRRNLGVWLSSNPPRVFPYAEAVEVPCKESPLEWMKTPTYVERNESYTNGPLGALSHPSCVDAQHLNTQGSAVRSTSCGHYCLKCALWTELLLAEEAPDVAIPMPAKSWLHDIYFSAALFPALGQSALE